MRGRSRVPQVMFGHEREVMGVRGVVRAVVVVGHPGQQGQSVALGERGGGAGQEEEGNLRGKEIV